MRKVEIGTSNYTEILCTDEPGEGGACHNYEVKLVKAGHLLADICFQRGPVKENELNGIFMEDLLAICVDRLQHFQAGDYRCRENALALTKIQESMHWMRHRTEDRQRRNVEGTSKK